MYAARKKTKQHSEKKKGCALNRTALAARTSERSSEIFGRKHHLRGLPLSRTQTATRKPAATLPVLSGSLFLKMTTSSPTRLWVPEHADELAAIAVGALRTDLFALARFVNRAISDDESLRGLLEGDGFNDRAEANGVHDPHRQTALGHHRGNLQGFPHKVLGRDVLAPHG